MITTYKPTAAQALYTGFVGWTCDDPKLYVDAVNKRADCLNFFNPMQCEVKNLIKRQTAGGGAIQVRNATGGNLLGPVALSGYYGLDAVTGNPIFTIVAADAATITKQANAILLATLATATSGVAYLAGSWTCSIDLSGGTVGDPLYVAAGGNITRTKPTGANFAQVIGYIQTNVNNGVVSGIIETLTGIPITELSPGTSGQVMMSNATPAATWTTLSIDATVSATGAVTVASMLAGLFIATGPASTAKTYTFPNASCTVLTTNAAVTIAQGGTNATSAPSSGAIPNTSSATVSSWTCTPTFGVAGTTVGTIALANATSGTITLSPSTGALGSSVITFPALTGNVPINLSAGAFEVQGPSAARTYTFPDASCTILTTNAAVSVAQGGTGLATLTTAYGVVCAGTTATGALQNAGPGSSAQIFISQGAALPTWNTVSGDATISASGAFTLATNNSLINMHTCDGRLTLTTAVPVTTSDVTGATTIYWSPYKGGQIALYTSSKWQLYKPGEISLALGTLADGTKPYDVFAYDSSGTVTLEFLVWTSTSARATALVLQDGVLCKSGALTRRYLGTFMPTATTTTEDSKLNRYLWNYYHRVKRFLSVADTTTVAYTYNGVFRQRNNSATWQFNVVVGYAEDTFVANAHTSAGQATSPADIETAIGIDSTSAASSQQHGGAAGAGAYVIQDAKYTGVLSIGQHKIVWLESSSAATTTWYSGNTDANFGIAMTAEIFA